MPSDKQGNSLIHLKLNEISAVPKGAQEGAKVTLIKQDQNMTIETPNKNDDAVQAQLEEMKKSLAEVQAENSTLRKISEMESGYFSYFRDLSGDAARSAFLAMNNIEKSATIAKAESAKNDADPVVYTTLEGDDIRKSAGAAIEKMARKLDAKELEIAKLHETNETARLEKAAQEYANLPGDAALHLEVAKFVDGLEGDMKEAAQAMFKSHSNKMEDSKTPEGTIAKGDDSQEENAPHDAVQAAQEIEKKADALAKESGQGYHSAYMSVIKQHPELYKATQA